MTLERKNVVNIQSGGLPFLSIPTTSSLVINFGKRLDGDIPGKKDSRFGFMVNHSIK